MLEFIHVSDLHFHRGAPDNLEAEEALDSIQGLYPGTHLLVTGDITDDGHPQQYENALASLRSFGDQILVCPGNHDYGAAGNFFSVERAQRFDAFAAALNQGATFYGPNDPVVHLLRDGTRDVVLIALDSNRETESPFDFACGEIGERQLASLDRLLSGPAVARATKLVMFHHHPFVVNDPFMRLVDAEALWRILYGRIDVLLFGHKHESRKWTGYDAIPFVLAADNLPGKDWVRRITVRDGQVAVEDVPVFPRGGPPPSQESAPAPAAMAPSGSPPPKRKDATTRPARAPASPRKTRPPRRGGRHS